MATEKPKLDPIVARDTHEAMQERLARSFAGAERGSPLWNRLALLSMIDRARTDHPKERVSAVLMAIRDLGLDKEAATELVDGLEDDGLLLIRGAKGAWVEWIETWLWLSDPDLIAACSPAYIDGELYDPDGEPEPTWGWVPRRAA